MTVKAGEHLSETATRIKLEINAYTVRVRSLSGNKFEHVFLGPIKISSSYYGDLLRDLLRSSMVATVREKSGKRDFFQGRGKVMEL